METFEYAIKKDVRNNPIVREVDERRLREQRHTLVIVVLFVAVVLFSGWQRVELLQHGYRVEHMQEQRADEAEINRHLRLEIETLRSPQRIELLVVELGAAAHAWGLREGQVVVMIHAGSLGLGHVANHSVLDAMKAIYPAGMARPRNEIYLLPEGQPFAATFEHLAQLGPRKL